MQVIQTGSGRRAERVPLDALVELRTGASDDDLLEADGLNVSIGGMAMRSPLPPAAGTRLECRFRCPPDGELVCAQGEVVWSSLRGPTLGTFGLRFVELDTKSATFLRRFVAPSSAHETAHGDRRAATLSIEGLGTPVEAELKLADETRIVVEQRLSFLQLGRGVEVSVGGRSKERGRIASVELRHSHYDVPTIVYGVLLDSVPERADGPAARRDGIDAASHTAIDEPIELVRAQVASAPRARRSSSPAHEQTSEPFHHYVSAVPTSPRQADDGPADGRKSQPPMTGAASMPGPRNRRLSTSAIRTSPIPPALRQTLMQPTSGRHSQPPGALRNSQVPSARSSRPPPERDLVTTLVGTPAPPPPSAALAPRTTMLGLDAAWVRATAAEADAEAARARAATDLHENDAETPDEPAPPVSAFARESEDAESDDGEAEDEPEVEATRTGRARVEDEDDAHDEPIERNEKSAGVLARVSQIPLIVGRLVQAIIARLRALGQKAQPVLREQAEALDLPDAKTRLLLHVARARGVALAGWARVKGVAPPVRATGRRLRMQRATLPGVGPAEGGRLESPRRVRMIAAAALAVMGIVLGFYALSPRTGKSKPPLEAEASPAATAEAEEDELTMEVEPALDPAATEPTQSRKPKPEVRADKSRSLGVVPADEALDPQLAQVEAEGAPADDEPRPRADSAKHFGDQEVPNGRVFTLRMNGPVARIQGREAASGFVVRIPGRLAVDRASPIATAHSAVARAMILNRNGSSELTLDFLPGLKPRYQVVAKHDTLEITLERIEAAAHQSPSAVKSELP